MADEDDFVPDEIEGECTQCHKALTSVDALLKPAMAVSKSKLEEKVVIHIIVVHITIWYKHI